MWDVIRFKYGDFELHCFVSRAEFYYKLADQDILPQVKWLIIGSKLSERVPPKNPIDLRFWLSWAVFLREMSWLAVTCELLGSD